MIENIELENFKCFENLSLELKNVNVLTGINGMGKSTVIQSLLLLRQSFLADGIKEGLHVNGKYLNLGVGKDVLYEKAQQDQIKIVVGENKARYEFCFGYESESDILPLKRMEKNVGKLSLFQNRFSYISAYRIEPQDAYTIINEKLLRDRNFGNNGEYAIQYLKLYGMEEVENLRIIKKNDRDDQSVATQVRIWLDTISPGVFANITIDKLLQKSVLQYEFIEGKNKTATFKSVNVGFGITYVLPIIVALVAAKQGDILIIENPEAHIHPSGQRMLGELIAAAGAGGVQIFLETHSDHVLNGIRVATKRGKIGAGEVKLFYFYKEETQEYKHQVTAPILYEDGKISEWPTGFFDEWDNALLELI